MKIYEIGTGYTPIPAKMGAATEIVVEELTQAFLKKGIEVEILDTTADDREETQLPIRQVWVPKWFQRTDVQLGIRHKLKRILYSVSLAFLLKRLLKTESETDIVLHFHNQYNLFFFDILVPKKLRHNAKIIYTNHSYIWHGNWEDIQTIIRKRYFQETHCLKMADYVFVLNEQTKRNIVEHIHVDAERVYLVPNGVNTEVYHPLTPKERDDNKNEYGLGGRRVFIHVGSVCERKNQLGALSYLLPILQEDKNAVFCYAGGVIDTEYKTRIEQLAIKNNIENQVRFYGELSPGSELNRFYNLGDSMIFPSKAEGFSLVVLEAMAAGVPVMIEEALQFSLADACIRFNPEDFSLIAKEKLFNLSVLEMLADSARHSVLSSYSWDRIAEIYLQVLTGKYV